MKSLLRFPLIFDSYSLLIRNVKSSIVSFLVFQNKLSYQGLLLFDACNTEFYKLYHTKISNETFKLKLAISLSVKPSGNILKF